jgi:hypothetical protein
VEHLAAQPGLTDDPQELAEGRVQLLALAPDVRGVAAVVVGRDLAQRGELAGAGVAAGRVDQRRGDAERAIGHLLGGDSAHPVQLRGRGGAVVVADGTRAQRARADERRDVLRGAAPLDVPEVLRQPGPAHLDVQVPADVLKLGFQPRSQRPHRGTLAEHLGRDPLGQLAERPWVVQDAQVRVAEDIDEPRAHRLARRVDNGRRLARQAAANRHHPVTADAHVSAHRARAGAVVDIAARDQDIEHQLLPPATPRH